MSDNKNSLIGNFEVLGVWGLSEVGVDEGLSIPLVEGRSFVGMVAWVAVRHPVYALSFGSKRPLPRRLGKMGFRPGVKKGSKKSRKLVFFKFFFRV